MNIRGNPVLPALMVLAITSTLCGCSSVKPTAVDLAGKEPAVHQWSLAIPKDVPRAEVIGTSVPQAKLAALVPQVPAGTVSLVAYDQHALPPAWGDDSLSIAKVNDRLIQNWGQLHDACKLVAASDDPVQLLFAGAGGREVPVDVTPETLRRLEQHAASDQPLIRISDGGNSAVLIRENGVECEVTARVQRDTGMLHLILALSATTSEKQLLPKQMSAACAGQPLRCLSVADTLELIYGGGLDALAADRDAQSLGFAETSERDDYLIPVNYKRLAKEVPDGKLPTLASLPGIRYPGPAILGDARALSSFLMQREFYQASQEQRVGWVLFAGESLRTGSSVELDLDLGSGPRKLRFTLPPM